MAKPPPPLPNVHNANAIPVPQKRHAPAPIRRPPPKRATSAWDRLLSWAIARWREFRRQPKYFQYRVYIIAIYGLLAVLVVFSSLPRSHSNKLHAYVFAARGDFVVGSYIAVRNDSSKDWKDVIVTVNDNHTYRAPTLAKGDRLTIKLAQLEGTPTLTEAEVQRVHIQCSRGEEDYPVHFDPGASR